VPRKNKGRSFAVLQINIWDRDEFRALSPMAQWLYLHLISCHTLNSAGVAEWRPARIAGHAKGLTVEMVEAAGVELAEATFVVIDAQFEEVLVRTHIRHDKAAASHTTARAVLIAYGITMSPALRATIVKELRRLLREHPEYPIWRHGDVAPDLYEVMGEGMPHPPAPSLAPSPAPALKPGTQEPRNPVTQRATREAAPLATAAKKPTSRKTACRPDFMIKESMAEWAKAKGYLGDIDELTEQFVDHHIARGTLMADWDRGWQTWVRNQIKYDLATPISSARSLRGAQPVREW
jgi:hypothetical protein